MIPGFHSRKAFDNLTDREILALAIASEEEDSRVYATYAERLGPDYPHANKIACLRVPLDADKVIFLDASLATGLPTIPIQNVEDDRQVYASASELAQLLRVNVTQRHDALIRVLKAAADEIDHEVGTVDINGLTTPYSNPPAIVREVNLERAVEHWKQEQSPFGIIGMGDDLATYTARDSWDRHAHKLAVLKGGWGLA